MTKNIYELSASTSQQFGPGPQSGQVSETKYAKIKAPSKTAIIYFQGEWIGREHWQMMTSLANSQPCASASCAIFVIHSMYSIEASASSQCTAVKCRFLTFSVLNCEGPRGGVFTKCLWRDVVMYHLWFMTCSHGMRVVRGSGQFFCQMHNSGW